MRRRASPSVSARSLPLSLQSLSLLRELATYGIYGRTVEEVAARLVDEGLQRFVPTPVLKEPKR